MKKLPRLAQIYQAMVKLEIETELNSINAKKYLNLCREALKIMESDYHFGESSLKENLAEHESYFARHQSLNAFSVNTGARTDVHICCIHYNLFLMTEGWVACSKDDDHGTHWVVGKDTLCKIFNVKYTTQPGWHNFDPCTKCRKILFDKCVKEMLKEEPIIPKKLYHSRSPWGINVERERGFFILKDRDKKVIEKIKDIGYGKMTEKQWVANQQ